MNNTAIRAEKQKLIFKNDRHQRFYEEWLPRCRYQDVYHKALIYCPGINEDTREHIHEIYDFETGCVRTECLHEEWITSGAAKVIRISINLYCNGVPSVYEYKNHEEQLSECRMYTVEDLFCSGYARYFWEAIKLRYPEYCFYVDMEDFHDQA